MPTGKPDLARYPRRPWLKEQSIWAIAVYRFGRRVDRRRPGLWRTILERMYWLAFRFTETMTGISLPKSVPVGPGLKIWHFGNIFIHGRSVIGANCTLRQGVTIGNRVEGGPAPVIEDDVELGAYAQILGGIRIARGARVGAMSVVLRDVPPGSTAVGNPARIIEPSEKKAPEAMPEIGANRDTRPAVFLDRDGTVIEHVHYIADPDKVRLLPHAAAGLRRLQAAGYALVVVTNQSAIGRGMITVDQYERVNAEMLRRLEAEGVTLDAVYYCPEVPGGDDPTVVTQIDRKPGPGMLLRASQEHGIDLTSSWMAGDMISDVLAGINAGCQGCFLVETGNTVAGVETQDARFSRVADLAVVASKILD